VQRGARRGQRDRASEGDLGHEQRERGEPEAAQVRVGEPGRERHRQDGRKGDEGERAVGAAQVQGAAGHDERRGHGRAGRGQPEPRPGAHAGVLEGAPHG
jgi:hypothetical protein